jgi:preprotein translocase subunit SecD
LKGKKLTKILMSILLVLISIAVIVIAFVGIYLPNLNKLKNIIPDYTLGSEIDGVIEYRLKVDDSEEEKEVYLDEDGNIKGYVEDGQDSSSSTSDDEDTTDEDTTDEEVSETGYTTETRVIKSNNEEDLTTENFEKSKKILADRLENAGATEYSIRLDEVTGDMVLELSQNDDTSYLYEVAISAIGDFDIIDYQTGVVLMDKTHLKDATVVTSQTDTSSYTVYLQLTLDEEGRELIKEMSNTYTTYTDDSGEEQKDYISIRVDGSSIMTTYFGEEYDSATLNIPISEDVSASDVNTTAKSVEAVAYILTQDTIPVKYTTDSSILYIESAINENAVKIFYWAVVVVLVIILVVFVIKYKARGFLAGIMNMALIGLVIIVLKYTKVVISLSSMVAMFGVILLNLIFLVMYLKNLEKPKEEAYIETLKSFYSIMFPVLVISFIFTFFVSTTVTGLGSVLFWGMLLQIIYNTIIVKYVLEGK